MLFILLRQYCVCIMFPHNIVIDIINYYYYTSFCLNLFLWIYTIPLHRKAILTFHHGCHRYAPSTYGFYNYILL